MKTLGIDLSLVHTGVAVLEDGKQLYRGSIKTKPEGKTPKDEIDRLWSITNQIGELLDEYDPDLVAIEGLAFMSRKTTALAQLAGLNYLVRREISRRNKPFVIVAPSSLKKFITNKGNAQKDEVMLALYKRYGVTIVDNNEADGYGLAQVALAILDKERKITGQQKTVVNLISTQVA